VNAITEVHGQRVLTYGLDEPTLGSEQDAVDLIGLAYGDEASVVVVPADRVVPEFYTLSTRVLGGVVGKFTSYRVRLVVLGDVSAHLAASDAFRAYVHETNRGRDVWFLATEEELSARLAG
jgi:hypothetical protein